jgi:hypothetical protein
MTSSEDVSPSARRPAILAHFYTFILLVLSLVAATGLVWTAYHLHRLDTAISNHTAALHQYQIRQEALFAVDSMDVALHRYLLDGNAANADLIRLNKDLVERLAQQDAAAQSDRLLQDLVAREQQWYLLFAQPIMEQRRQAPAGMGVPEEVLNRYRTTPKILATFDTEMLAQAGYQKDLKELQDAQKQIGPAAWLRYSAVGFVVLGIIVVALGTFRNIGRLHRVARGDDEEEEDEEENDQHA